MFKWLMTHAGDCSGPKSQSKSRAEWPVLGNRLWCQRTVGKSKIHFLTLEAVRSVKTGKEGSQPASPPGSGCGALQLGYSSDSTVELNSDTDLGQICWCLLLTEASSLTSFVAVTYMDLERGLECCACTHMHMRTHTHTHTHPSVLCKPHWASLHMQKMIRSR